jgi:CubicO group peptidase (beta-lactamase class C family)
MLEEEGKLKLGDRLETHLDKLPVAWRAVTVRQLLNHTSGIPDIEEIFGYDSYRNIYNYDQIIGVANYRPVDFPPGTKFKYSNTGYFLLAHVVQKVEGESYDRALRERIFNPLGMTHTRQSDPTAVIPNRCAGYQVTDNGLINRDAMQPTACLGAGTIVSTIEDMARWDSAITHNRLLKADSQRLMWEKTSLPGGDADYGFGWSIGESHGHPCVSHAGGTAGFSCNYRRFQDLGLSIVIFTNLYNSNFGNIECRAADAVHPGLSYVSFKPIDDDPKVRDMLLSAMADVAKGGSGSKYITEAMWRAYPEVSHRDWKERLAGLKSFQLLEHTRHAPIDSGHGESVVETYVYRLETGARTFFIVFKLTPDGRIALQQRVEN